MKKITLLLFMLGFVTLSYAQIAQNFGTEGSDESAVLTINASDITVNGSDPITGVSLGTFTSHYNSASGGTTWCGQWFAFDLAVTGGVADGTTIIAGCDAEFNGLDITGFTTLTISANNVDGYMDYVFYDIDLMVTFTASSAPVCTSVLNETEYVNIAGNIGWSASAGIVDNYEVTVGTASGLSDVYSETLGNVLSTNIGLLEQATTYYVTVTPSNAIGAATGCVEQTFTTLSVIDGAICETAISIDNLPYNTTDDTANYGDDYGGSPGASGCTTTFNYLNGDDVVYAYTATSDTVLNVALSNLDATYSGIFVYTSCADIGVECAGGTVAGSSSADYDFDLPVTNGTTYYFVISTWATPQSVAYTLDITELTCPKPMALTATNITTTSADLGWTEPGTATLYNVEVVLAGETPTETPTDSGVANGFTKTNLISATGYVYYVQADCGDSESLWEGPFAFSTLCETITDFPWSEDFEDVVVPNLPNCWEQINNNEDTSIWQSVSSYGVGSSKAVGIYTDFNEGDNDDYLVLPHFELTGNERLKYSVRARSGSEPNDYKIVLSTTGKSPADFTVDLKDLTVVSSITYLDEIIDLSDYTGEVYIAVHIPSGGLDGWFIYFDNFIIEEIPSCLEPSALSASVLTATSVELSWTENNTPANTDWEYVVQPAGSGAPAGAGVATTSNPVTVTSGLVEGTSYEFYVRSDCGDSFSTWEGPYTFNQVVPPSNDLCANAIALTVNEDDSCTEVTSGTIMFATASGEDEAACSGTENDDVWFSFVATNDTHIIDLVNVANGTTDLYHSVWSGTCGALTNLSCSDPNSSVVSLLTVGETYLLRVNSWTSTPGQTTTFDVCVGTPPPSPDNNDCDGAESVTQETGIPNAAAATATPGTILSATPSGLPAETCNGWSGTANDDVWYSFVALTEDVNITYNATFDAVAILYSGDCGALTVVDCSDSGNPEEINATGLTVGETYYTRVFQYGTSTTTGRTFDVKIWSPTVLSIQDFESEAAFTYYPNPTKNTLTLNAQNSIEQVAMYNMLGQEVLRATPNTLNSNLDMSNLQTGTYFVKVTIANVTTTVRVVKQ